MYKNPAGFQVRVYGAAVVQNHYAVKGHLANKKPDAMSNRRMPTHRRRKLAVPTALLILLSGCATYKPHPLDTASPLRARVDALRLHAAPPSGQAGAGYTVNPADGLDLVEIGVLAVLNNPDLRTRRAQWRVSEAQVFNAGLLPDPQVSYGLDKPTGNTSGLVDAWSLGLNYDLIPLVTHGARIEATERQRDQVRLDLLWQEWQVMQQARLLAVRQQFESERLTLLRKMHALYSDRYGRSARALRNGDITLDVNGTDLTALLDTSSQINQLEQTHNQTRHDLNSLLGLVPDAEITLTRLQPPTSLEREQVDAQLPTLSERRPDLLALKAGYASQEASVRAAILTQFPSLGVGITRARDTGDVRTAGFSISLTLPLLSGNRGNIAIERATREHLREEFRARLAQTRADIDRLLTMQTILQRQTDALQRYLPQLKTLVDGAEQAYRKGDIDALTFLNMESTWVNKRLEQIGLAQTSWENDIALTALLALPSYPRQPLLTLPEEREQAP